MKNKRIRFDDRFYWTTLNIALLVIVLFFLLLMINNNAPLGICVFLSIVFSLFLCGLYVFPKMGLYFNYRLGIIKYLGPHKIKKRLIKMCEIEKIEFIEIWSQKTTTSMQRYRLITTRAGETSESSPLKFCHSVPASSTSPTSMPTRHFLSTLRDRTSIPPTTTDS